jgi:hypothetical protein
MRHGRQGVPGSGPFQARNARLPRCRRRPRANRQRTGSELGFQGLRTANCALERTANCELRTGKSCWGQHHACNGIHYSNGQRASGPNTSPSPGQRSWQRRRRRLHISTRRRPAVPCTPPCAQPSSWRAGTPCCTSARGRCSRCTFGAARPPAARPRRMPSTWGAPASARPAGQPTTLAAARQAGS